MDTPQIVDISEDNSDSESIQRSVDRRRWEEVKKYIPFLQCIKDADPERNDSYIQLLKWLQTNKEFPARVSNMCENTIRKRYEKLKSTMVFPQHVVEIFTKVDFIEISDSEDDDDLKFLNNDEKSSVNTLGQSSTSGQKNVNASTKHVAEEENKDGKEQVNKCASSIRKGKSITNQASSSDVTDTSVLNDQKQTRTKVDGGCQRDKESISKTAALEEGEIISDNEETKTCDNEVEVRPLSATLQRKFSDSFSLISLEDEDDIINRDLFKRIDSLAADSTDPEEFHVASWQELEKVDKDAQLKTVPSVQQKNNNEPSRGASKSVISPLKTILSEEEVSSTVVSKKKKKKHKHKKKGHNQINDWCLREVPNYSENGTSIRQKIVRMSSENDNLNIKISKKQKKRHREKKRKYRALLVSDDEDEVAPTVNANTVVKIDRLKTPESELFSRREKVKEIVPSMVIVEIPDSDDEPINSRPISDSNETQNVQLRSSSPVLYMPASSSSTEVLPSKNVESPNLMDGTDATNINDITDMELTELNDILLKLLGTTGIQLEELLKDMAIKTKNVSELNQEESNNIASDFNSMQQHKPLECDQFEKQRQQQFQLLEYQHQMQQQLHHQQNQQHMQQQMHQFQLQQQSMQAHGNLAFVNRYQTSLRHGLNLNDPRIMRRLKEIKDSPIHNMITRESANVVLMNSSQNTSRPIVPGNSRTATTYGEHKRLRELEKQKELERLNVKKSAEISRPKPSNAQEEQGDQSSSISRKHKSKRTNSSGSENDNIAHKSSDNERESSCSSKKRRRTNSSSVLGENVLEETDAKLKGRRTPKYVEKVLEIVMPELEKKSKETPENLLSKLSMRRNSRKSTDSMKSDLKELVLNDTINSSDDLNKDVDNKKNKRGRPKSENLKETKSSPVKRGCRELNNLNCTFRDYSEMFGKNCLPTVGGKRRCNAQTTVLSRQQLNSDTSDDEAHDMSHETFKAAPIRRRRQTCSALQTPVPPEKNTPPALKAVVRRLSVSGNFGMERNDNPSEGTDEFDIEEHRPRERMHESFEPILRVKLRKLSFTETVKTKDPDTEEKELPPKQVTPLKKLNRALIDSTDVPILVPVASKSIKTPTQTTAKLPKVLNNDINMTFELAKSCAICKKRPLQLTFHYVVQHKGESYNSRLSGDQIENLEKNINIALPVNKRYSIECAFCQDIVVDKFVNLHTHYSSHTGEFGFKCDTCDIVRPYRSDVRSHQLRSSRCRNGKIRTNYLYSSNLSVIYVYVCKLCNFVQLNEANIHKHQRDHHGFKFDAAQQVKKCIIAATNDGEVINEVLPSNPEDQDNFEVDNSILDDNSTTQEQEFVHEHPLDIKDVVLTQENPINQTISQSQVVNEILQKPSEMQQPNLTTILSINEYLNVPKDIPSPEVFLAQLHAPQSLKSVMTVIHCSDEKSYPENHQPFKEAEESKPDINDIKIEPPCTLPSDSTLCDLKPSPPKICFQYRRFNMESKYFGLYKCTLKDCWFSTNMAECFVQHMTFHCNEAANILPACPYCIVKSSNLDKLVRHIRSRHSMSRYQCSDCSYRSMIPGNVVIHRKLYHEDTKTDKRIFECAGRVRNMDEKLAVIRKKMIETVGSLKCPGCTSEFYAISSLNAHVYKTHPDRFFSIQFHNFVCIYCKDESNSMKDMQTHLATEHPDDMGYVIERQLKSGSCEDRIENLNLVNLSLPILPTDIHPAPFDEMDNENLKPSTSLSEAPKNLDVDVRTELLAPEGEFTESSSIESFVPNIVDNNEEQIAIECIKPLLELLTEHTGVNRSKLYPCKKCNTFLVTFDLWRTHVLNLHNVTQADDCPHCSTSLQLNQLESHFESHLRHEYICFYCIMSFSSRAKIREHFVLCHPQNEKVIEKAVPFGKYWHYIVKNNDNLVTDWVKILAEFSKSVRHRWIQRLQKHTKYEWWEGLALSCLEEIEFPQYITNEQCFKCLVRSCSFVGLNQNDLDLHLIQHTVPQCYSCDHCTLCLTIPSWEQIINHDMLHKENLHVCSVCKFFHHNRSELTKHIEKLHNSRDVPVISMWRDALRYKISVSIVLPQNKTEFATSYGCFCCGKEIRPHNKLKRHLRAEHNITLCSRCELCGEILLTPEETKAHAEEHNNLQIFRIKYNVLATYLYTLIVKSLSPLVIETKLKKEKRNHEENQACSSKGPKLDDSLPSNGEVIIKKECDEDEYVAAASSTDKPSCSIKCVNINQLVENEPLQSNNTQRRTISVKAIAELQIDRAGPVNVPRFQHFDDFNSHQNQESIHPYSIVQVNPSTVIQHCPRPERQIGPPQRFIIRNVAPNHQTVTAFPQNPQTYVPPRPFHSYHHTQFSMDPLQHLRMLHNTRPTVPAPSTMTQPILQDQFRPGYWYEQ